MTEEIVEREYNVFKREGGKPASALYTDVCMLRWYENHKAPSQGDGTRTFNVRGIKIFMADSNSVKQAKIRFRGNRRIIDEEVDAIERRFAFILEEVKN